MTLARVFTARTSPENPSFSLSNPGLSDWLNGGAATSGAGVAVTEAKVYGLPAYYRAVALLSSLLAGLPLKVYRTGTRERIAQRTVLDDPNPRQTPFEFWQTMFANAITWGNAFANKIRNGADVPVEVWPLHPSGVAVRAVRPTKAVPDGKLYEVSDAYTGAQLELTSWDVMHLPYLSLDGVSGIRPLQLFRQAHSIAIAAETTAARFYGSGGRISGVLKSTKLLSKESAERLQQRWSEKYAGPENVGRVAVLDNDTTFVPISIPPADAQLLDSRRWSVSDVARMVGIPPHLLAEVTTSTSWGTGIAQQQIGLRMYTAKPWLDMSEQRVTWELLPGGRKYGSWYAEWTMEGLERADPQTRGGYYALLIQWGVLTRNEVRALENLEPLDGLDEPLTPSNMTLVQLDGSMTPLGGAGAAAALAQSGA